MGFETQEQAEAWFEVMEIMHKAAKERRALAGIVRPEFCQIDDCKYPLCECKVPE